MFRNEVAMMPAPTLNIERNDAILKRFRGHQCDVAHSNADFTAASTIVCHTMAQAPIPATASHIPTTPLATRPTVLLTAIIFTSIRLVRRLVCTIAVALMTKARNITLAGATSLPPASNKLSISGEQNHNNTYIATLIAKLK